MTIYIVIGMLVVSVVLIAYALLPGKSDEQEAIQRRMSGKRPSDPKVDIRRSARESMAQKMVQKVAPFATRPVMPKDAEEMSRLSLKLANAGFRRENSTTTFLASKTLLGILCALAGLTYGWLIKNGSTQEIFGWTVFMGAVGFMGPNIWLSMAVSKRGKEIRNGLPDSLDLMVICVESGLALDAAIQRVGDEMKNVHPLLSEEFQIATLETQMGIPRAEALGNLASRTGIAETRSLVSIVNQAERFGTSVANALRNQADALRVKRRQAAEEQAQKTTVKLMMPLIMFIFPAIFVVLAGPAALKIMHSGL